LNIFVHDEDKNDQSSLYLVDFNFDKRDLKDILNEFAQLRGINILYSSTTQLNAKVTFNAGKKITFMKAWEFLLMMLEQAGFSLVSQGKDMYALISSDLVSTTPLPIFINTDPNELPLTQERIRYIYYFKNISLTNQQNDLTMVLRNFFDPKTFAQQLMFETGFNAMIITAKSEMIKAVMKFIDVFDQAGEKQIVDIFNLQYANSTEVATILNNLILGQDGSKSKTAQKPAAAQDAISMFGQTTRVVSLFGGSSALGSSSASQYGNAIVIMGKKQDVMNVKKFIKDHLDIAIEKGKSFFHIIEPQWLSASVLVNILQDLVTPPGGGGQSTNVSLSNLAFDPQIKIVSESVANGLGSNSSDLSQPFSGGVANTGQRGGNKLIIAATNKDWARIEEVIAKIDVPQEQVIIEALILDLQIVFTHKLAAQIRTNGLSASIFPKSMQAQAALLLPAVLQREGGIFDDSGDIKGVEGDLSKLLAILAPGGAGEDQSVNSSIYMIGDAKNSNGIWAFFQLLSLHASSKTISRAFVVAQNNVPAEITNSISKRLPGKLTQSSTPTVSYQTADAPVTVKFTPLISKKDIVNLQIDVDASYWQNPVDGSDGTSSKRKIQTNFSLKDGQVAILGGLTKNQTEISYTGVPFLSKIPIIGPLFFSNKKHTEDKTKLFMIVRITKTKPRFEGGMGKISRRMASVADYALAESDHDDELFSSIKDPITRWIFEDQGSDIANGLPLHDLFMKKHSTVYSI
jgi:general secretion pathway protein D